MKDVDRQPRINSNEDTCYPGRGVKEIHRYQALLTRPLPGYAPLLNKL